MRFRDGQPPALSTVYRCYDARGALIYVGITGSPKGRLRAHAAMSQWWPQTARLELEHFTDWQEASDRELALIREHSPPHNVEGVIPPRPRKPRACVCIDPRRLEAARVAAGLRMTDLARKAGVSVYTIWSAEQGLAVSQRKSIDLLAAALGVEPQALMTDEAITAEQQRALRAQPTTRVVPSYRGSRYFATLSPEQRREFARKGAATRLARVRERRAGHD